VKRVQEMSYLLFLSSGGGGWWLVSGDPVAEFIDPVTGVKASFKVGLKKRKLASTPVQDL
jgi:hypothetical protein